MQRHGGTSTTREFFLLISAVPDIGTPHVSTGLIHSWTNDSLQTPVYAIYAVPTIVSAAILLATRHLGISLPSTPPNCWWDLFDAPWEDVWIVCGHIMRLYRERTVEERHRVMRMINKKEVRKWLEEQQPPQQDTILV